MLLIGSFPHLSIPGTQRAGPHFSVAPNFSCSKRYMAALVMMPSSVSPAQSATICRWPPPVSHPVGVLFATQCASCEWPRGGRTRVLLQGQDLLPARHGERFPRPCLAVGEDGDMKSRQSRVQQRGDAACPQHVRLSAVRPQDPVERERAHGLGRLGPRHRQLQVILVASAHGSCHRWFQVL